MHGAMQTVLLLQFGKFGKDLEALVAAVASLNAAQAKNDALAQKVDVLSQHVTAAADREALLVSRVEILERNAKTAGSGGTSGGVDKPTAIAIANEALFRDNIKAVEAKVQETRDVLAGATKDIVDLQNKVSHSVPQQSGATRSTGALLAKGFRSSREWSCCGLPQVAQMHRGSLIFFVRTTSR